MSSVKKEEYSPMRTKFSPDFGIPDSRVLRFFTFALPDFKAGCKKNKVSFNEGI